MSKATNVRVPGKEKEILPRAPTAGNGGLTAPAVCSQRVQNPTQVRRGRRVKGVLFETSGEGNGESRLR